MEKFQYSKLYYMVYWCIYRKHTQKVQKRSNFVCEVPNDVFNLIYITRALSSFVVWQGFFLNSECKNETLFYEPYLIDNVARMTNYVGETDDNKCH